MPPPRGKFGAICPPPYLGNGVSEAVMLLEEGKQFLGGAVNGQTPGVHALSLYGGGGGANRWV